LLNEILGGVFCVFVLAHVAKLMRTLIQRRERFRARLAFAMHASLILFFSGLSVWFGLTHVECFSTDKFCNRAMQPYFMTAYAESTYKMYDHVFRDTLDTTPSKNYFQEASFFLRDRDPQRFLTSDLKTQLSKVDVWINCYDATSGVMTIAAPDKPMISVAKFLDLFDYMQAEGAQRRVRVAIESQRGKRMYTLVLADRLEPARKDLGRAPLGLRFGSAEAISIPLYSPYTRTNMMLVEVLSDQPAIK